MGINFIEGCGYEYSEFEGITEERLSVLRDYSFINGCDDFYDFKFYMDMNTPDGDEVGMVTSVWMDRTGRFPLDNVGAIKHWGLSNVIRFVIGFDEYLRVGGMENEFKGYAEKHPKVG